MAESLCEEQAGDDSVGDTAVAEKSEKDDFEAFDVEEEKITRELVNEEKREEPKPAVNEEKREEPKPAEVESSKKIVSAAPEEESSAPKASDIFMLARQQNFQLASKLLEAYPHLWFARDEDGHSLLHWASLVGSKDFVQLALKNDVPVDCKANNDQTPLMWASLRGHSSTARLLIASKADLNASDSLGATPTIIAIQHAMYQPMLLFMGCGNKDALLADSDKNGCTSAHWAAYKGDLTSLKFLDYFGADLLALDHAGMQPLHRAVFGSQAGVVEFLMEKKADPMLRNGDGKNCIDIAESQSDISMQSTFKRLMKKGFETSGEMEDPLTPKKKELFAKRMQEKMKDKHMHKVFPLFWIVCVSLAAVQYISDLRATAWTVAPNAAMFFELGVPFSLIIFAITALGDPGKVPARPIGNSGVEEMMRELASPEDPVVDISRLCTTTWVIKGLRSKYCKETCAVVEEFDHYCVWLNCAIGRDNHRPFILLAIAECFTQCSHIFLMWSLTSTLVTAPGWGAWFYGVGTGYPLLALLFVLHCFTAPWVFMLFLHQMRLVLMNLTTNEMMNAGRYEHFWSLVEVAPGRMQRMYRNPFNKGGYLPNLLDFFWFRNRAKFGSPDILNKVAEKAKSAHGHGEQCCQHGKCHAGGQGHGHSHGAV